MNDRISSILQQIRALEEDLRAALHEQETKHLYSIDGTRIKFEQAIRDAHRKLKMGFVRWLRTSRPRNALSVPFVYGMIFPILILDACLSGYQAICFGLYGIPRVRRSDYIVIDRHHLPYLNIIEKLNCTYCGYANGLIAYACEIIARTEQYWCPIKHARKVLGSHERYVYFTNYGDAKDFYVKLEEFRKALSKQN